MSYQWPLIGEFLNREADLERIDEWWRDSDRILVLYGRRRVGKSWLFRAFAHRKDAVILVADAVADATQLRRFADTLEPVLPVRPELRDVRDLFRTLFRAARQRPLLAVIDELPYLLPTSARAQRAALQRIQAVIEEERDESQLKLILCGSQVAAMEGLLAEGNPLRGRLDSLPIEPLSFWEGRSFLESLEPEAMIERYAVTGGMPRYLRELGRGRLETVVSRHVLDGRGFLFNEPRAVLAQELREARLYFSILEQLAAGAKRADELGSSLRREANELSPYLETLQEMRIVEKRLPVTAAKTARGSLYRLADPFFAFWFRFVFPYQEDLSAGLTPEEHYRAVVGLDLSDHVAPMFEDICRAWTRRHYGETAQRVGRWWGNALNKLRASGERSSEEIDIVGISRARVTLVGECRWRRGRMSASILKELNEYKLPALRQAKIRIAEDAQVLLFSRGGFSEALRREAAENDRLRLVEIDDLVAG